MYLTVIFCSQKENNPVLLELFLRVQLTSVTRWILPKIEIDLSTAPILRLPLSIRQQLALEHVREKT